MNSIISRLNDEFEKMEKTINYQKKIIEAATVQKPACPCDFVPPVTVPDMPKLKLDDCSWDEIAMYAQSGMADKVFALGDTKKITLKDGSSLHVRIIDFKHDTDKDNNILPITFETVETLNEDIEMNTEPTNKFGWQNSHLRKVLNTSVFGNLPDDLRSVIKPCLKKTSLGGNSEKYGLTSDNLFVLSEQEIFGRKIYSHGGEGFWYEWYRQENTEYGKCKQNGERDWRWERSPRSGNATGFCSVGSSGTANNAGASTSRGVSFGFCV